MQTQLQLAPEDGRWLSAEGPYRDCIAAWCKLNPNLRTPDTKNLWSPLHSRDARVSMLEISRGNTVQRHDFSSAADLLAHLRESAPTSVAETSTTEESSSEVEAETSRIGRIYIMEDLATDYNRVLGDHFHMDPKFFMQQERTTIFGLSHQGSQQSPGLPSLTEPGKMFLMRYCELRDFDSIKGFSMWCARTCRNISTTRSTRPDLQDLQFEPIGIIRRKCSFWSQRCDKKGWVAVILCDPPIKDVLVQTKDRNLEEFLSIKYSTSKPERPLVREMPNKPFAGGYLDFIKHPDFGLDVPEGPPRSSMLEDLCFYWREHGTKLSGESGPASATVFLQKIVASNYLQLIDFVRANISNLEFQLSRRSNLNSIQSHWTEERWSDLQSWVRRCSEYIEDVEDIMISLGIPFPASPIPQNDVNDWTSCYKDFQYIHYRLKSLKARVDVLSNSITGLAGIAGNQQALAEAKRSLKEAKNIKTLTLVGMVFIPLALCTGIFSMNDQYLPGRALFWVYFAVSGPLIVFIFLVTYLIGIGYDSEGKWNIKTFFQSLYKVMRVRENRYHKQSEIV